MFIKIFKEGFFEATFEVNYFLIIFLEMFKVYLKIVFIFLLTIWNINCIPFVFKQNAFETLPESSTTNKPAIIDSSTILNNNSSTKNNSKNKNIKENNLNNINDIDHQFNPITVSYYKKGNKTDSLLVSDIGSLNINDGDDEQFLNNVAKIVLQPTVYVVPDEGTTIKFKCAESGDKRLVYAWILPTGRKIYPINDNKDQNKLNLNQRNESNIESQYGDINFTEVSSFFSNLNYYLKI